MNIGEKEEISFSLIYQPQGNINLNISECATQQNHFPTRPR